MCAPFATHARIQAFKILAEYLKQRWHLSYVVAGIEHEGVTLNVGLLLKIAAVPKYRSGKAIVHQVTADFTPAARQSSQDANKVSENSLFLVRTVGQNAVVASNVIDFVSQQERELCFIFEPTD